MPVPTSSIDGVSFPFTHFGHSSIPSTLDYMFVACPAEALVVEVDSLLLG